MSEQVPNSSCGFSMNKDRYKLFNAHAKVRKLNASEIIREYIELKLKEWGVDEQ